MAGLDREKQERLLSFAGWLHHKHRFQTRPYGGGYTEVRFTREVLSQVPALSAYSTSAGAAGERALIRDVGDLSDFGIDVRWEASTQQWVSRAAPLTDEECQALATAALHVVVEETTHRPISSHIPGAGLSVEGAEMIVAYAPTVDLLVEAVRTRSSVRFLHRGMERTIDPWHVFLLDGRWYVVGRDHGAEEQRVFAVDAIDALSVGDRTDSFEIPRSDWTRLSEVIRDPDEWTDGDAIDVVIRVDPRIVGRAELLLGAEATGKEADDAWVEMTCTVRNVDAFMHRLWGLRARAVVVKPRHVRDAVVEYLHRIV